MEWAVVAVGDKKDAPFPRETSFGVYLWKHIVNIHVDLLPEIYYNPSYWSLRIEHKKCI